MTERSELVERYLGIFIRHMENSAPNSATADNARRAAESLVDAVREEERREERARCLAKLDQYRSARYGIAWVRNSSDMMTTVREAIERGDRGAIERGNG
jgi:hypothetical protein